MLDSIDEIPDMLKAEPEHFTPGLSSYFFDGAAEHGNFPDDFADGGCLFGKRFFGNQTGHV